MHKGRAGAEGKSQCGGEGPVRMGKGQRGGVRICSAEGGGLNAHLKANADHTSADHHIIVRGERTWAIAI